MKRDELGYAIWVLVNKLWDNPLTNPPNKPRVYWKEIKRRELNRPDVEISLGPEQKIETPIPFEVEYNMPNLNWTHWVAIGRKYGTLRGNFKRNSDGQNDIGNSRCLVNNDLGKVDNVSCQTEINVDKTINI